MAIKASKAALFAAVLVLLIGLAWSVSVDEADTNLGSQSLSHLAPKKAANAKKPATNAKKPAKASKSSAKAKPQSGSASAWALAQLTMLATHVEAAQTDSHQKLSWQIFDKDRKSIATKSGYSYDPKVKKPTEQQMLDDAAFKSAFAKGKYVMVWRSQVPCFFGSPHNEPCTVILPKFAKANSSKQFFIGYSTRHMGKKDHVKFGKKDAKDAIWALFQSKLTATWHIAPNGHLAIMTSDKKMHTLGDWKKVSLIELEDQVMIRQDDRF